MGLAVLLVLTAAAWVMTSSGPDQAANPAAAPEAGGVTATTGTAPESTVAKPSGEGPKNLLPNASFEAGAQGWKPLGGARVERSTDATEGGWSLRVLADPSGGPVGITVPDVTLTKLHGYYHTNAWVRPSAPGTTVTIGIREYHDGKPVPGSNTLGWTVDQTGWRHFGAIHVANSAGSRLALEIMARDLPPGGYLDVDQVVLHLLPPR